MKISKLKLSDLTGRQRQSIYRLNYGKRFAMYKILRRYFRDSAEHWIITALDDNKIIGWAVVDKPEIHVYVRKSMRKRGIGTRLVKKAIQEYQKESGGKLQAFPWSIPGNSCFQRFNKIIKVNANKTLDEKG